MSAVFLAKDPPNWILGAAPGAGAGVPAVALQAASRLVAPSRNRIGSERSQQVRRVVYALIGAVTAATVGTYLVLVLVACGVTEILVLRQGGLGMKRAGGAKQPWEAQKPFPNAQSPAERNGPGLSQSPEPGLPRCTVPGRLTGPRRCQVHQ